LGKFVKNLDDFFVYTKDNEVKFVDFRFSDINGTWHHVSYNLSAVNKDTLSDGFPFDGSSIPAWQPINKSDMMLKPDAESAFLDPFTADVTIIVICDIYDIYAKEMYSRCPRSIAKKAIQYLNTANIADVAYFGPENEFFIFDDVKIRDEINCSYYEVDTEEGEWNGGTRYKDGYNTGHRPGTKGGYFPVSPVDSSVDLRAEIVEVLNSVGLETFVVHHEVGQGQAEIGVKFDTLVQSADNVQILKYIVKNVCHLNGKTATFMPKPLHGDNGNGMHVHQSIWKDGKNLFYGDGYASLSKTALYYIGGVLKHARALSAFTNASTNSYKRLVPGYEAPNILAYSAQNRSASCRIPYGNGEQSVRAEFRFPDSTANPYLAFSAMLLAGLDGIKNETHPGEPMDDNLFEYSLDEIREKGIGQMPHTLRGSLESLIKNNDFLSPVMTKDFIDTYQHYKFDTQVLPDEQRPTPFEFKASYSC